MSEINLKVANDNGNSEHDIIINGKLIRQPNVYSKVRKLPSLDSINKENVIENIESNLIVTCEEPNGIYFIGENALKSGNVARSIEVGIDNNKIASDIVTVNTLAQISGYAAAEQYKANGKFDDDIIRVKVDMGTSLPVSYYNDETELKFSDKFLSKKHMNTVHIGNSICRVETEFTFVKTIPEGVTAAWALCEAPDELFEEHNKKYNDKLDKNFFKNAKVLHMAIGEGTTEFPVTNGIEFDPNFIEGTHNGIGHAIDKSLDEFKNARGLAKFSRQDYSEVIKDKNHKYYDLAVEIVDPYIEEQAEEILHKGKTEIQRANNDLDIVCVYGGGSILMRKYLEEKLRTFCDRAQIKVFYVPAKYAVLLEVEGLNKFVNSKIFNMLKAQYKK